MVCKKLNPSLSKIPDQSLAWLIFFIGALFSSGKANAQVEEFFSSNFLGQAEQFYQEVDIGVREKLQRKKNDPKYAEASTLLAGRNFFDIYEQTDTSENACKLMSEIYLDVAREVFENSSFYQDTKDSIRESLKARLSRPKQYSENGTLAEKEAYRPKRKFLGNLEVNLSPKMSHWRPDIELSLATDSLGPIDRTKLRANRTGAKLSLLKTLGEKTCLSLDAGMKDFKPSQIEIGIGVGRVIKNGSINAGVNYEDGEVYAGVEMILYN